MHFNKANLSYDFCYSLHKVSLKKKKKYNVHVNKKRRKQKEKKKRLWSAVVLNIERTLQVLSCKVTATTKTREGKERVQKYINNKN